MKEASGEANLTVVTIILIGVVVAIATPIVNDMMSNTSKKSCCMSNGGVWASSGGTAAQCYASCDTDANGNPTGCTGSVSMVCDN